MSFKPTVQLTQELLSNMTVAAKHKAKKIIRHSKLALLRLPGLPWRYIQASRDGELGVLMAAAVVTSEGLSVHRLPLSNTSSLSSIPVFLCFVVDVFILGLFLLTFFF